MSPDIITAVYSETCRCVSAEKIRLGDKLIVLGLPAPRKWRSQQGLELWQRVVQNAGINDEYAPIEKIAKRLLRL